MNIIIDFDKKCFIKPLINDINLYKTYNSDKIVLDIETDGRDNILQIAYNIYDIDNNLIQSKDFYIYDGKHSKPVFPTINEEDIINKGISLKDASNIITTDINNTNIIIGHNIKSFDLRCINKLNNKFNNKIKDSLIIHDTMIGSKYIINAKNKLGKIKYPRLDEMLMFLCNKSVDNYHNAIGDVIATFECYKILCDKYKCFQLL
jgi:DNA polymerase III epsilon subunit-like protein